MPAARDANYLIKRLREEVQTFGSNLKFVDGLSTPASNETSLLAALNRAMGDMALLGYAVDTIGLALSAGTALYTLPATVHKVKSVWIGNNRLIPTSIEGLDARDRDWRSLSGTPTRYVLLGRNKIGFKPNPSTSPTASLYAVIAPGDLTAGGDTPAYLPVLYHDYLVDGAAIRIANMDQTNPVAQARIPEFKARWDYALSSLADLVKQGDMDEDADVSLDSLALPPTTSYSEAKS